MTVATPMVYEAISRIIQIRLRIIEASVITNVAPLHETDSQCIRKINYSEESGRVNEQRDEILSRLPQCKQSTSYLQRVYR